MPYPTRPLALCAALFCGLAAASSARAQMQGPNQPDRTVTKAERTQVVEGLSRVLKEKYVFPAVADKMAARLVERLGTAYDTVTSAKALSRMLTDDLRDIAHDKHLNIFYSAETIPSGPPPGSPSGPDRFAAMNYAFEKVERLPGNVGYLKFNGFFDPAGAAGDVAAAAMAFVAGTDALIIDVRDNGGGSPGMVAFLCTYLFDGRPVHLNDLYWRASDATQQFWTLSYVPGRRYVNKDVYVLTSGRTFSAAEEFTNNLKTLKRATIVGETTGGGANPGGVERLSDHFS
ncbi:MAG: S41 family peptidase, partial [Gemmatimonadota bacterium]